MSILDNLVTNYDIKTVAVEGSSGYVDTSSIASFPDKEIKKTLADELMADGRISAAEYFSITTDSDIALYGIDDKALHVENMDAFRSVLEHKEANHKKAKALYNALAALEPYIYSDDLKVLEENSILKNNGKMGFTKKWDVVRALGEKNEVKPASYTNINNLLKAVELEKKCDFASTNTEREALLNELKTKLDKNRLEELILKSLSFKLGKLSASMFYSHLVDAARIAKLDMAKYPNVSIYVEYMSLYESVDVGMIKDEVVDYENKIKDRISRNDDERKLSRLLRDSGVLSDLIETRLTSTSLKYFKAHRDEFKAQEYTDFIRAMYRKYNLALPKDLDITAVFDAMPPAEAFYELTLKRNDAMVANTVKLMRERGQTTAAMVTGGFHSEGITELLKSDRLSYLVILPKFDKDKKRPYVTIITNNKKAYEGVLDSGEFYIALESLFNNTFFRMEAWARVAAFMAKMRLAENRELRERFAKDFLARQDRLHDQHMISGADWSANKDNFNVFWNNLLTGKNSQGETWVVSCTKENGIETYYAFFIKGDNVRIYRCTEENVEVAKARAGEKTTALTVKEVTKTGQAATNEDKIAILESRMRVWMNENKGRGKDAFEKEFSMTLRRMGLSIAETAALKIQLLAQAGIAAKPAAPAVEAVKAEANKVRNAAAVEGLAVALEGSEKADFEGMSDEVRRAMTEKVDNALAAARAIPESERGPELNKNINTASSIRDALETADKQVKRSREIERQRKELEIKRAEEKKQKEKVVSLGMKEVADMVSSATMSGEAKITALRAIVSDPTRDFGVRQSAEKEMNRIEAEVAKAVPAAEAEAISALTDPGAVDFFVPSMSPSGYELVSYQYGGYAAHYTSVFGKDTPELMVRAAEESMPKYLKDERDAFIRDLNHYYGNPIMIVTSSKNRVFITLCVLCKAGSRVMSSKIYFSMSKEQFSKIENAIRANPAIIYDAVKKVAKSPTLIQKQSNERLGHTSPEGYEALSSVLESSGLSEPTLIDNNGVVSDRGKQIEPVVADTDRLGQRFRGIGGKLTAEAAKLRPGGAQRRMGTYKETGAAARAAERRILRDYQDEKSDKGESLRNAVKRATVETNEFGQKIAVVEYDCETDSMAGFHFNLKSGTIVIIINKKFIDEIIKKAGNRVTYEDIVKEVKFHEGREAYWISRGYSARAAHIRASAEQAKAYARDDLGGLTPYHYAMLSSMTDSELETLLTEDRANHLALYERFGIAPQGRAYESKIRMHIIELVAGRVAEKFGVKLTSEDIDAIEKDLQSEAETREIMEAAEIKTIAGKSTVVQVVELAKSRAAAKAAVAEKDAESKRLKDRVTAIFRDMFYGQEPSEADVKQIINDVMVSAGAVKGQAKRISRTDLDIMIMEKVKALAVAREVDAKAKHDAAKLLITEAMANLSIDMSKTSDEAWRNMLEAAGKRDDIKGMTLDELKGGKGKAAIRDLVNRIVRAALQTGFSDAGIKASSVEIDAMLDDLALNGAVKAEIGKPMTYTLESIKTSAKNRADGIMAKAAAKRAAEEVAAKKAIEETRQAAEAAAAKAKEEIVLRNRIIAIFSEAGLTVKDKTGGLLIELTEGDINQIIYRAGNKSDLAAIEREAQVQADMKILSIVYGVFIANGLKADMGRRGAILAAIKAKISQKKNPTIDDTKAAADDMAKEYIARTQYAIIEVFAQNGLGGSLVTPEMVKEIIKDATDKDGRLAETALRASAQAQADKEILDIVTPIFSKAGFAIAAEEKDGLTRRIKNAVMRDTSGELVEKIIGRIATTVVEEKKSGAEKMVRGVLMNEGLESAQIQSLVEAGIVEDIMSEAVKAKTAILTEEAITNALAAKPVQAKVIAVALGLKRNIVEGEIAIIMGFASDEAASWGRPRDAIKPIDLIRAAKQWLKDLSYIQDGAGLSRDLTGQEAAAIYAIASVGMKLPSRLALKNAADDWSEERKNKIVLRIGQELDRLKVTDLTKRQNIEGEALNRALNSVWPIERSVPEVVKLLVISANEDVFRFDNYDVDICFQEPGIIRDMARFSNLPDPDNATAVYRRGIDKRGRTRHLVFVANTHRTRVDKVMHEIVERNAAEFVQAPAAMAADTGVTEGASIGAQAVHGLAALAQATSPGWIPLGARAATEEEKVDIDELMNRLITGEEESAVRHPGVVTPPILAPPGVSGIITSKAGEAYKLEETNRIRHLTVQPEQDLTTQLTPLIEYINSNEDANERLDRIAILITIARDQNRQPEIRRNARAALCGLLGVTINIDAEFTKADKKNIFDTYVKFSKNEEKRAIFSALMESALLEKQGSVYDNFRWLSSIVKTMIARQKFTHDIIDLKRTIDTLIEVINSTQDLYSLHLAYGELLTIEANLAENIKNINKAIAELENIIGQDFDADAPQLVTQIFTDLSKLKNGFDALIDVSNPDSVSTAKEKAKARVSVESPKEKLQVEREVAMPCARGEIETLVLLWQEIKKRDSRRPKQKEIDDFKADRAEILGGLTTSKKPGQKEAEIIDAAIEMIRRLFTSGKPGEATILLKRLLDLNNLYMKHFYCLNMDEIKPWASWIKKLSNVWGEDLKADVTKKVKESLSDLAKGAGVLSKEMEAMLKDLDKQVSDFEEVKKDMNGELSKTEATIASGIDSSSKELSDAKLGELKQRVEILKDGLANNEKELDNAKALRSEIEASKKVIDDAGKNKGVLDASVDKAKLEETLIKVFLKAKATAIIRKMKEDIKREIMSKLEKDEKGNYTAKSMRKAYEEIAAYDKFIAMACVDMTMKQIGGYAEGLYGVQLLAGLLCADGYIVNLKTGEGKTEFSTVALTIASLTGFKAFAETSNPNLARSNHLKRKRIFDFIGLRSELFDASSMPQDAAKRLAIQKRLFDENTDVDIVTFDTAGFNFMLADDIVKENTNAEKIVQKGRKFLFVITDEIDASLREAATQYRIALQSPEIEAGTDKFRLIETAVKLADEIIKGKNGRDIQWVIENGREAGTKEGAEDYYYIVDRARGTVELTETGKKAMREACAKLALHIGASAAELNEWVEKAIKMIETYNLDVNFTVVSGVVKLYDASGLVSTRRLSDGLHTILEMYLRTIIGKQYSDLVVHDDSKSKAELGGGVARIKFFAINTGASGTAVSSAEELDTVMGNKKGVADIPANIDKLITESMRLVIDGKEEKVAMLREWVRQCIKHGKKGRYGDVIMPSLLYIRSSAEARIVKNLIASIIESTFGIKAEVQIVNGEIEKADLDKAIEKSGMLNTITIFTDAGARGTDYQAFFGNIRTMSAAKIAAQFEPLAAILRKTGVSADKINTRISELRKLLLLADMDEYRDDINRPQIVERIEKLLDEIENEIDGSTLADKAKIFEEFNKFRSDVEVRYITGFKLLSQVSDKSVGDLLQALGRVGRQADPAHITLFFDLEKDLNIISNGFEEDNEKMGEVLSDIKAFRFLNNRLKTEKFLSSIEMEERDRLRQKIYSHAFGALLEYDKRGQKERGENHTKDIAVFEQFTDVIAEFRAKVLRDGVKELTGLDMALKWLDEIAEGFADAKADAGKIKMLRAFFVMILGEKDDLMAGFAIKTREGKEISIWNLDTANMPIFTEVLKALIQINDKEGRTYEKLYDGLSKDVKSAVDIETFKTLSSQYNTSTLLTDRFKALFREAVAELLQYQFYQEVARLRQQNPKDFEAVLKTWCNNRMRDMAKLMPKEMIDILTEGTRKELDKPASQSQLEEERAEKAKAFGDIFKSMLKVTVKKTKTLAGRISAGATAGAGFGAALGSVIPVIGTIIGAAVGGVTGALTGWGAERLPAEIGWKRMVKDYGSKAIRYAAGAVTKQAVRGAGYGAIAGVLIGTLTGGIIGGIGGAFFGGVGFFPGLLGGMKAGSIIGFKLGALSGLPTGFISGAIYGIKRVFSVSARRALVSSAAKGEESEIERTRAIEEHREPLAKITKASQEVADERDHLMKAALGKDAFGNVSPVIKALLAGETKLATKTESTEEIRARISRRPMTGDNRSPVDVAEIKPKVGKDGNAAGGEVLTPKEGMEALSEQVEYEETAQAGTGGGKPPAPGFVYIPYRAFAAQSQSRSDEDGNDDDTVQVIVRDILGMTREQGAELSVSANSLSKTDEKKGRGYKGVVSMTKDEAKDILEIAKKAGVPLDLNLGEGENAAVRIYDGNVILLVRCDNGQIVVRNFGREPSAADKDLIRTTIAMATFKAKGRSALVKYDSPTGRRERARQEKDMSEMLRRAGMGMGDANVELALVDANARDILDNTTVDSEDITITPTGIFINKPASPAKNKETVASFKDGTVRAVPQKTQVSEETIVLPLLDGRAKFMAKLARWISSRSYRIDFYLKTRSIPAYLNEKLKDHSILLKTVNFAFVSFPKFVRSIFTLGFIRTLGLAMLQTPEMINDRLVPWLDQKWLGIVGGFKGSPKPDEARLLESYVVPAPPDARKSLCIEWFGKEGAVIIGLLDRLAQNNKDKDACFELARALDRRADEAKMDKNKNIKEYNKLNALAGKFYFVALYLDEKNRQYHAAFAKLLNKQGKNDEALKEIALSLKVWSLVLGLWRDKLDVEARDEILRLRAKILKAQHPEEAAEKKEVKEEAALEAPLGFWAAAWDTLKYGYVKAKAGEQKGIPKVEIAAMSAGLIATLIIGFPAWVTLFTFFGAVEFFFFTLSIASIRAVARIIFGRWVPELKGALSAVLPGFWTSAWDTIKFAYGKPKDMKVKGLSKTDIALIVTGAVAAYFIGMPVATVAAVFTLVGVYAIILNIITIWSIKAVAKIIFARWIPEAYNRLIKGEKPYSAAREDSITLAADRRAVKRNPEDMEAQLRLINHYLVLGWARAARRQVRVAQDVFSKQSPKLALFAIKLLDAEIADKKLYDRLLKIIREEMVESIRKASPGSNYINAILAKTALKEGNAKLAVGYLENIDMVKLDLADETNRAILHLKLDILKTLLDKESKAPAMNKEAVEGLQAKITAIVNELDGIANKFTTDEKIALQNTMKEAKRVSDSIEVKQKEKDGADYQAVKDSTPDKNIAEIQKEKEEKPETVEAEKARLELEVKLGLDPNDFNTRMLAVHLYIKQGNYAEAEKLLDYVIKKSKDKLQISQASEIIAAIYLIQNKTPRRKIVRKIIKGDSRDLVRLAASLKRWGRADTGTLAKLASRLIPLPPDKIGDREALLLVAIIPPLTNDVRRARARAERRAALAGLRNLRGLLEERDFTSKEWKDKLSGALKKENIKALAKKTADDTKIARWNRRVTSAMSRLKNKIRDLRDKIAKYKEELKSGLGGLKEEPRLRATDRLNSNIEKEKKKILRSTAEYEAKYREAFGNILTEDDPEACVEFIDELYAIQRGYIEETSKIEDAAERAATTYARLMEMVGDMMKLLDNSKGNVSMQAAVAPRLGGLIAALADNLRKHALSVEESELELKRDRFLDTIDKLKKLFDQFEGNKDIQKSIFVSLDRLVAGYVDSENEIASAKKDRFPANWRGLTAVLNKMNELQESKQAWETVLRLKILARYMDIMFDRRDGAKIWSGFKLGWMADKMFAGFNGLKGVARDAAMDIIVSIAGRNITHRGRYHVNILLARIIKMKRFNDPKNNAGLRELFIKIFMKGIESDTPQIKYAEVFVMARLQQIAGETDESARKAKAKKFVDWINGVSNEKAITAIVSALSIIMKGVDDEAGTAAVKKEVIENLVEEGKVPTGLQVKLYAYLMSKDVAKDVKALEKALSMIGKVVQNLKPEDASVMKGIIDIFESILKEHADKITDTVLVRIFNTLLAIRAMEPKDEFVQAGIKKMLDDVLKRINNMRKEALRKASKARVESLLALAKSMIDHAGLYEDKGEREKAAKLLEEANKILNDELKAIILLQDEGKLEEEYDGSIDGIIDMNDEIVADMKRVLGNMDKLDAEWYMGLARGEILLTKIYTRDIGKAKGHMKKAFDHLMEAERLDPRNEKLKLVFELARLEDAEIDLNYRLNKDYKEFIRKREESVAKRDKALKDRDKIQAEIDRLSAEINTLLIPGTDARRRKKAQETKAESDLTKKDARDLELCEEASEISGKRKELKKRAEERDRLDNEIKDIEYDLTQTEDEANAIDRQLSLIPTLKRVAINAIDVIIDGGKDDEVAKAARAFLLNIKDYNALRVVFASVDKKRKELESRIGRNRKEKELEALKALEFDILYKLAGKAGVASALKEAVDNKALIENRTVNATDLLEYLAKKLQENKKELVGMLWGIIKGVSDNIVKAVATTELLNALFELAGLKENPDLFKEKDTSEIGHILYKILAQKFSEKDKLYESDAEFIYTLSGAIRQALDKSEEMNKKWDELNPLERKLVAAAGDERTIETILRLDADRFNAQAIAKLGKKELDRGNIYGALTLFDKALAVTPDLAEANLYKAKAFAELGRFHDAVKFLKKALEKEPENRDALEELKKAYGALNDDMAIAETDLKLSDYYMKKAKEDEDKGRDPKANYEKAEEFARDANFVSPRSGKAKVKLVQALIKLNRPDEARSIADGVISASNDFITLRRTWFRWRELKRQRSYGPILTVEDSAGLVEAMMKAAITKKDVKGAREALDIIKDHWNIVKKSPIAALIDARANRILGNRFIAWGHFRRALRLAGDSVEAQKGIFDYYMGIGGYKAITKAIGTAEKLGQLNAAKKKSWDEKIARLYVERSKLRKGWYERGITKAGRRINDLRKAGELAEGMEKAGKIALLSDIRDEAQKLLVEKGVWRKLGFNYSHAARKTKHGEVNKMKLEALRMIVLHEDTKELVGLSEINDIIDRLRTLSEDDNTPADIKEGVDRALSAAYRIKGDRSGNMEDYAKAIKLDEANYKAHYGIARIYEGMNKFNLAVDHLEKAKENVPDIKEGEELKIKILEKLIEICGKPDQVTGKAKKADEELRALERAAAGQKDELNRSAELEKNAERLVDQAMATDKLYRNLRKRCEKLKKPQKAIKGDSEIERAIEFIDMDMEELEALRKDRSDILAQISSVAGLRQLAAKAGSLGGEDAASLLEEFLELPGKKGAAGRVYIMLALAKIYSAGKTDEGRKKAIAMISEIMNIKPAADYNVQIEAKLLLNSALMADEKYDDALKALLEAVEIYKQEAWGKYYDDRMQSELVDGVTRTIGALRENKKSRDIGALIRVLKAIDNFDPIGELTAFALSQSFSNITDIINLLEDGSISKDNKRKIAQAILDNLKVSAGPFDPGIIDEITKKAQDYKNIDSSAQVWALFAYMYELHGRGWWNVKLRYARWLARRSGAVVEKGAASYMDAARRSLRKSRFNIAITNLEKAAGINKDLLNDPEFKKLMFDSLIGKAEKKIWIETEKKLKNRIETLNSAAQSAYDEASKSMARSKLVKAYDLLLAFYEREGRQVRRQYVTRQESNRVRIEALLQAAGICLESFESQELVLAESYYERVLNIEYDNKKAEEGLEKVSLYKDLVSLARNRGEVIADKNKDKFFAEVCLERARKAMVAQERKDWLNKAAKADPGNIEPLIQLAEMARGDGNFDEARNLLNKAIDLSKSDAEKTDCKNRIAKLDEIDGVIDRIVDSEITIEMSEAAKEKDKYKRESELRTMRARFSKRVKDEAALRTELKKFYRESIGLKAEVSREEGSAVQEAVEKTVAIEPIPSPAIAAGTPAVRLINVGERMLASTRDQELERLLYEADKAGIPDERFNLLQAKRLIVQAPR
ncbi:MAG: hypothetical protein WC779_01715 [Candidatus Omnitrophota bacterium]